MADHDSLTCSLGPDRCPIYLELERSNQELHQLREQVIRDPMTGLYNKRYFSAALATEMERSRRNRLATSLILLDIDHFKRINDTYGHVAGDKVLERLARILEQTVRMIDIPCRYGGEEFAIILPSTPLTIACQVAERVRAAIEETRIALDAQTINITASLGVSSFFDDQESTPLNLIERADKELYTAKQNGRNRVQSEPWIQTSAQVSEDEREALFGDDDSKD
jgi:two-component system, cell cycle response regulator